VELLLDDRDIKSFNGLKGKLSKVREEKGYQIQTKYIKLSLYFQ